MVSAHFTDPTGTRRSERAHAHRLLPLGPLPSGAGPPATVTRTRTRARKTKIVAFKNVKGGEKKDRRSDAEKGGKKIAVFFPSGQISSERAAAQPGPTHQLTVPPLFAAGPGVVSSHRNKRLAEGGLFVSLWPQRALPRRARGHSRRPLATRPPLQAGIKGTPRRGRDFRRYPLRQDGRWPGVGRRKEEEEGGSSHLPAAVPAGREAAGGRRDRGSVRSRRPAGGSTRPRQHCSPAGSLGALPDPLRWPLVLCDGGNEGRVSRVAGGGQGCLARSPSCPRRPPAHPAFCSTPPRPWCSPTGQQAGAAGAPPAREELQGPERGRARGPGAADSNASSRRPRRRWDRRLLLQLCLEEGCG